MFLEKIGAFWGGGGGGGGYLQKNVSEKAKYLRICPSSGGKVTWAKLNSVTALLSPPS